MKRKHTPVYYHVQFIARAGFWTAIFYAVWMVVTHLWFTDTGIAWTTNPFGN